MCKLQTDPNQSCAPLGQDPNKKVPRQNTAQLRLLASRGDHKRSRTASYPQRGTKVSWPGRSRDRLATRWGQTFCCCSFIFYFSLQSQVSAAQDWDPSSSPSPPHHFLLTASPPETPYLKSNFLSSYSSKMAFVTWTLWSPTYSNCPKASPLNGKSFLFSQYS